MTKASIPSIEALPLPFGMLGDRVPPEADSTLESLGFTSGYQVATSDGDISGPPSKFVYRQTLNRLFNSISYRQFLSQCGIIDTFDRAESEAIGGYGAGAILQYLKDGILYDVISLVDYNKVDFNDVGVDGVNWEYYGGSIFAYIYPDYGLTGASNIIKSWTIPTGSSGFGEAYTIPDTCFIQVYPDNTTASGGASNYQSGIFLCGKDTSIPESLPQNNDVRYMFYELLEGGSVNIPVIPVTAGTKIIPYYTSGTTGYNIKVRRLSPTRSASR